MYTREMLEQRETQTLAPYAAKSAETKGRQYSEPEHPFRTSWQRDKDRVIHCTAFRRLEYKTQVFVNHEGDYYRTRLTHTLEVAQIARSISRILGLNEDLVEAIALAHDMGHTPFGHSGEDALNALLKQDGGFEHNAQGLRVVETLEDRYPEFPGLNLTLEVREGLLKGHPPYRRQPGQIDPRISPSPTLEAQLVNLSDEIAYNSHDIDDGIKSGVLGLEELREVELCREILEAIQGQGHSSDSSQARHELVKNLINRQVTDVATHTARTLEDREISHPDEVRQHSGRLVSFSPEMDRQNRDLKHFLRQRLYRNFQVLRMADKSRRMLTDLFQLYVAHVEQLPPERQKRCETEPVPRVVADYIAGMTDRYAAEEYRKLFIPLIQV